ncbi:MAG: queuine tRNA-ribosyltransferase [Candidatus Parcubacteria bacterium]|nr:MAG: queuine tRNA-ribosyltransferase [Candidatus Parcubacteria bacterium]
MIELIKKDLKTNARVGKIETAKGIIETPAFVLKTHNLLSPIDSINLKKINTQILKTNAYEIWKNISDEGINFSTGIYNLLNWHGPIMTDSGSIEILKIKKADEKNNILEISNSGINFKDKNKGIEKYFDAEESLKIQEELEPDIITAFDLPLNLKEDENEVLKKTEISHNWQIRFLEAKSSIQQILGVLGGGTFLNLVELSAKFLEKLNFDGIVINNFENKLELEKLIKIIEILNQNIHPSRIKHIKNIESIKELFAVIKQGVDTFESNLPYKNAKSGILMTDFGNLNLTNTNYENDNSNLDETCACPICLTGITKKDLYYQLKTKNKHGFINLLTHNIYFFNNLMGNIRAAIQNNELEKLEKFYLNK